MQILQNKQNRNSENRVFKKPTKHYIRKTLKYLKYYDIIQKQRKYCTFKPIYFSSYLHMAARALGLNSGRRQNEPQPTNIRTLSTGSTSELPASYQIPKSPTPASHRIASNLRPASEFVLPSPTGANSTARKALGRCVRSGYPSRRVSTAWRRPRSSLAAALVAPPSFAAPSS